MYRVCSATQGVFGTHVTITGQRFGTNSSVVKVYMGRSTEHAMHHEHAEKECTIVSLTDSEIVCTTPADTAGWHS